MHIVAAPRRGSGGNNGMRLIIKATNFSLTPTLHEYIHKKIGKELNGLLSDMLERDDAVPGGRDTVEAHVEVGKTTRHHKKGNVFRAEITLALPKKKVLRAEAEEWDVRVAIDRVRDEIYSEIRKWKEKKRTGVRSGARVFKSRLKRV